jgi:hypothetical protein
MTSKSARTFVSAYIADIRVTPQGDMKGKVWIQSQAKFPNIKKNTRFSEWLNRSATSPTSPRIELKLLVLTGTIIFATGIFLNIVTRFNLVQNFQDQIWNALATTVDASGPIPEFQIEVFHKHGKTGRTQLYRMATSSVGRVRRYSQHQDDANHAISIGRYHLHQVQSLGSSPEF